MDFNHFTDYLNMRVKLFPKWEKEFEPRVKELSLKKGRKLLHPNEPCKSLYFIKSGFFRMYENNGLGENTIYFASNNQFITSIDSFLSQSIDNKGIVCEEAGTVFSIDFNEWLELENLSTDFQLLTKTLLIEYLLSLHRENNVFRTGNNTDKLSYLIKSHPRIGNIVSQKNIASYLGVTAATLSNILKNLNRENHKSLKPKS